MTHFGQSISRQFLSEKPKTRMKSVSLLLLSTLLVASCATSSSDGESDSPMSSAEACAASDGEWIPFKDLYPSKELIEDDLRRHICNLRTHDGGKACTDNRQCKGYCVAPIDAESGQRVTGECSAYIQKVDGTLTVAEGRVTYPMSTLKMTDRKSAMLQRLEIARQQWTAFGISDYEITVADENCFCLYGPYYGPNRVTVRDGKISRVIYRGERRDGFRRGDNLTREKALKHTLDEVFDRLERTIRHMTANTILTVEYDSEYGFPTLIDFDRPDWEDEQRRLVVSDFRPR
jgi:hypothetical protein